MEEATNMQTNKNGTGDDTIMPTKPVWTLAAEATSRVATRRHETSTIPCNMNELYMKMN